VADRLDDFQSHQLLGEEMQRPMSVACRRFPQTQGDQFRFRLAIEFGRRGRLLSLLALQSELEAFGHQTLAQTLDRLHATIERLGNPDVGPRRSVSIRLKEDLSPTNLLRRSFEFLDNFLANATLFIRQANDELLVHGKPPCFRKLPNLTPSQQPQFSDLKGH
jgi:hypothetical protein